MATSMHLHRSSLLGEDYIDMAHVQRPRATETLPEIAAAPLTWWQEWFPALAPDPSRPDESLSYRLFPVLAEWVPWALYYRDLAVYQVQRVFYVINYYASYVAWTVGRYKEAAHYYSQRFLYDVDDRLRRWADRIEATQGYGPLVDGQAAPAQAGPQAQVFYTEAGQPYYVTADGQPYYIGEDGQAYAFPAEGQAPAAAESQPYYSEEELAAYYAQLEAAGQVPADYLQPIPVPAG